MRCIYLLRHGEPAVPGPGRWCLGSRSDWPLSRTGREQAEQAAERLSAAQLTAVFSSPLQRCLQTAEAVSARCGLPAAVRPALAEIDMGLWDGRSFREIRGAWPQEYEARGLDLAHFRTPEGETFEECADRAEACLSAVTAESAGNILLVTHAGWIRSLLCRRQGLPLDSLLSLPVPYGEFQILTI